jgi:hypothetical protein
MQAQFWWKICSTGAVLAVAFGVVAFIFQGTPVGVITGALALLSAAGCAISLVIALIAGIWER